MLTLYRRLIALRRARPALSVGSYEPIDAMGDVLAYARGAGASQCLVALNLGSTPQSLRVPAVFRDARVLLSTALDREGKVIGDSLTLRGDEGAVAAVPLAAARRNAHAVRRRAGRGRASLSRLRAGVSSGPLPSAREHRHASGDLRDLWVTSRCRTWTGRRVTGRPLPGARAAEERGDAGGARARRGARGARRAA